MASPWSADFTGILLVRALSFSPAATGRSQDSTWIWLQSASSPCNARTSDYLWSFGSGCLHCGICLYSCSTGSTPPPSSTPTPCPSSLTWSSGCPNSERQEIERHRGHQSRCQDTRTPWPGKAMRYWGCPKFSNPLSNTIVLEWVVWKAWENTGKNCSFIFLRAILGGGLRAEAGPSPSTGEACLEECAELDQPRSCPLTSIF